VAIGAGLISVFGVNLVPLPPLPMFAAVPLQADTMMALLLAVPVCTTVLALMKRVPRLIDVPGLVVFVALDILVLTTLTYGELGIYGEVGPRILLTTGLMACWVTVVGLITAIVGNWVQRRLVAAAAAAEREAELFDEFSALAISESELEPQAAESAEPEAEEAHEEAESDGDAAADSDGEADAGLEDVDPEDTDSEDTTPEDAEEVKPDGGAVAASKGTDEDSWADGASTAVKDAAGPEISAETETDGESDTDAAAAGEVEPGGKNH
jgi:putative membrane protein